MKTQEQEIYELYKSSVKKYGEFHKCIFHLHTPASYDYYLCFEGHLPKTGAPKI